jgi:hypothetical protein
VINLGGIFISINPSLITSGTRQGSINCQLVYEDNTYTIFPFIQEFTHFIDGFVQNTENEYQIIIDNDNEEFAVLVNGVVLSLEPFSHLKNIKIDNQQFLRIRAEENFISGFVPLPIKISELIITQTDILQESTLFSLKLLLINDSLVFYDPTNETNVNVTDLKIYDISPNNSHIDMLLAPPIYVNNTHLLFNNDVSHLLKVNALTNSTVGELIDFSVNIWFYIQHSNDGDRLDQTLLVIGNVVSGNRSISLTIAQVNYTQFKISLKHYPTNMTINYLFEKNRWYNLIYVKKLYEYSFYVDSVFYRSFTMINPINLPINTPLSIGRDHSRTTYFKLKSARSGVVSVYERAFNLVELTALYEDYKKYYQNIPLISDALLTCDLAKPENVSDRRIQDISGNNNILTELGPRSINYDGETSMRFNTANYNLMTNLNMLEGNIDSTISIWLLVNKQTEDLSNRQRIFTFGSGRTSANSSFFFITLC